MTRIDVLLGEATIAPADVTGRIVVVIDVLRAATTAATALANGARAVIPFDSVDEAARRAAEMDRDTVRLAGERRMVRVAGFDFGNSPLEFTTDAVSKRTILLSTTNGTRALVATHGARLCLFAGFVNATATIDAVRRQLRQPDPRLGLPDVTIVCAGQDRRVALEDVVCAGRLLRGIRVGADEVTLGDGAFIAEMVERPYVDSVPALRDDAMHARALAAAGFADDVSCCLELDRVPTAVAYRANRLEVLPGEPVDRVVDEPASVVPAMRPDEQPVRKGSAKTIRS